MIDSQSPSAELHRDLLDAVDAGLVSRRVRGPLAIYNYTPSCAYDRKWTEVTRAARGLILEESTGLVVARPFRKFFNVGEMPETAADVLPWDEPHEVTEKLDGSLGIVFYWRGQWDIATRGAFESPQAVYARENLLPRYDLRFAFPWGTTILVEIVYPGNRIVVDYGDRDELVFLAALGGPYDYLADEQRRRAVEAGFPLARMALVASGSGAPGEHKANTEGFVIHWPATGLRVKIKSEEYSAAHRMLSQVTPRRVLEAISQGKDDDLSAQLPAHIRETFDAIRDELVGKVMDIEASADVVLDRHAEHLVGGRKDFAIAIKDEPAAVKALLFAIADEKSEDQLRAIAIKAVAKTLKAESPDAHTTG